MESSLVNHLHILLLAWPTWEESDEDEMDDLLLKAAELKLADSELTVGSDHDIDKSYLKHHVRMDL